MVVQGVLVALGWCAPVVAAQSSRWSSVSTVSSTAVADMAPVTIAQRGTETKGDVIDVALRLLSGAVAASHENSQPFFLLARRFHGDLVSLN